MGPEPAVSTRSLHPCISGNCVHVCTASACWQRPVRFSLCPPLYHMLNPPPPPTTTPRCLCPAAAVQEAFREKLLSTGVVQEGGILKVTGFLNHQVDAALLDAVAAEAVPRLRELGVTKVMSR